MGAKGKPRTKGSGRKSKYGPTLVETICRRLADGESIRAICAESKMPSWEAVRQWLGKHDEFRVAYARAKEWCADAEFDRMRELEDRVLTGELNPNAARVVLDSMRYRCARLRPKVYGDFKTLEHRGQMEFHVKRITLVDRTAPKTKVRK